eukprot:CAMPEP_0119215272 /NCGR_PEP_ID=MMETSP1327-20130426/11809_1 /TAXON_ID=38833 /ORGANISM="Micromonas pusilla, Strain RCC2306" /LENGTH=111 /DNA_ID=CAMNT_0007213073 /DNA_START=96 /DNA_END=428 /DNA_ORIENTATION=-
MEQSTASAPISKRAFSNDPNVLAILPPSALKCATRSSPIVGINVSIKPIKRGRESSLCDPGDCVSYDLFSSSPSASDACAFLFRASASTSRVSSASLTPAHSAAADDCDSP